MSHRRSACRDIVKAREERRLVLIHDLGFRELVAVSGATLPSVIMFRLRNMAPARVNGALQRIIPQQREILERGVMLRVTEEQGRGASAWLLFGLSPCPTLVGLLA